ncbi:MAG: hypothetical protein KF900_02685 [Bacteroidetes bacterium]|nr:hypothetical protein [Bacteroidota bacterium]
MKTQVPTNNSNEQKTTSNELPKMIKKQGTYSYMTHTGPHSNTLGGISTIVEDMKGNIWVATAGEGVYCYNGKTFINFTANDGLITNDVYSIMEDKEGNLWFGTTNGVSVYNGASFTNYPFSAIRGNSPAIGFETNAPNGYTEVWSMLQDNKGKIWLGTTNGVYCYNGTTFTNILTLGTLTSPLKSDVPSIRAVPAIIEDKEGNIWFTSWFEGLCRFDGRFISSFKKEGLTNNDELLQGSNGDIWIGNRGNGVSRYNGKNFERLFTNMLMTDIKEDGKGNIWFATFDRKNNSGDIICYNPSTNETISQFAVKEKIGGNSISSIAIDKTGNVWFGTNKMTLSKYDGKTFTNFLSE